MTPKQKRRLETLASDVFDMHDSAATRVYRELSELAAESTPKCGTCRHFIRAAADEDDKRCAHKDSPLGGIIALGIDETAFGCVLHSDYEETP